MQRIQVKLLVIIYWLLVSANVAFAQGLIPKCNPVGQPGAADTCNLCHLLQLFENIIEFMLLKVGMPLAALFIAVGAFVIMTAGGSEEKFARGKETMTIAITGLVIALASWLIIGTLLQFLTDSPSKLPWNQIQCTF